MLCVLPINLPVLVVWVHNLAVHWLTPFSSHHNVLSIMPFILLVETLTCGKMIPRVTSKYVDVVFYIHFDLHANDRNKHPLHHQPPLLLPRPLLGRLRRHLRLPPPPSRQLRLSLARGHPLLRQRLLPRRSNSNPGRKR